MLIACFAVTKGVFLIILLKKPLLISSDKLLHKPTFTFIPFDLSSLTPFPLTFGFGSKTDIKIFFMPDSMMAFVHGPVLPK